MDKQVITYRWKNLPISNQTCPTGHWAGETTPGETTPAVVTTAGRAWRQNFRRSHEQLERQQDFAAAGE